MSPDLLPVRIRRADPAGADALAVAALVETYLRQTEAEKALHLGGREAEASPDVGADREQAADDGSLPERYRREVRHPGEAYAAATVLLAESGRAAVGVVVVQPDGDAFEIKRLWVDPGARGRRVGSLLIGAAIALAGHPVPARLRLTVWDWRRDAVALYRRRGFVSVPSWEERPRLLCLERPAEAPR
jgi:ribosomal protein S18 acetylase RimI-like enzyme